METIVLVIVAILGVLQFILFFKLWSMTNNVKKILMALYGQPCAEDNIEHVMNYSAAQTAKAKKMYAIGEKEEAIKALKGVIYDLSILKDTHGYTTCDIRLKKMEALLAEMQEEKK